MASLRSAIRRALLYGTLLQSIRRDSLGSSANHFATVPGSSQKMIEKTRGLNVDCVAYDLEDSVTAAKKSEARANICDFLNGPRPQGIGESAVRINSIGSGLAEDDLNDVVRFLSCSSSSQTK